MSKGIGELLSTVWDSLLVIAHATLRVLQIEALNPDENKAPDVTPSDGPHFQLIKQAIMETLAPPEVRLLLLLLRYMPQKEQADGAQAAPMDQCDQWKTLDGKHRETA